MADYGSGILLDEHLDFEIDSSGDIASSSGPNELRKDMAFNIIRALRYGDGISTPASVANNGVTGAPLTQGVLSDIELAVGNVLKQDNRIDTVTLVGATHPENSDDLIEVAVTVQVDDSEENFELVIPA